MNVPCPHCDASHELEALEPSLVRPDAFVAVPPSERELRTMGSDDACAVRNLDGSDPRFYLRVLLPFTVSGLHDPYSWGVWVEVSEERFRRAEELWDDPLQSREPPFPGRLANGLHCYERTIGLPGLVSLTGPKHIPHFYFLAEVEHPLAVQQRGEVSPSTALVWVLPVYHPETYGKLRADDLGSRRGEY